MSATREDPPHRRHLDPLLRDLLAFGVVEPDPDDGTWRLVTTAQRRLDVLAAPPPPAEKVVHFGHRCAGCQEIRPTRRRPQGLLCDACSSAVVPSPSPAGEGAPGTAQATPLMTA